MRIRSLLGYAGVAGSPGALSPYGWQRKQLFLPLSTYPAIHTSYLLVKEFTPPRTSELSEVSKQMERGGVGGGGCAETLSILALFSAAGGGRSHWNRVGRSGLAGGKRRAQLF